MPDIFISYSRRDSDFAVKLVDALKALGRDVWIDFEDIPFASEWWEEICTGIDGSEAVIFILSPDSLESKVCGLEVNYATSNQKRLIPIVYRESPRESIPSTISHLNWIYFNKDEIFEQSFNKLVETIDTDLEALKQHTRLLIRARDWERKGHSNSLLLRGEELDDLQAMQNQPNLTPLQSDFLERSLIRDRRIQILLRFGWGFIGGFLGIGFYAFSAFRSNSLITPSRLLYTLALGQVFGLFIGLMSTMVGDMWLLTERRLSKPVRLVARLVILLVLGVLAWTTFQWFLEFLSFTPVDVNTLALGGVGLAAGFMLRLLFQLPGWAGVLLTALTTWLPIWFTFQQSMAGSMDWLPIIYFDDPNQVFTIGIPMALLIALGANATMLRQTLRGIYLEVLKRLGRAPGVRSAPVEARP